MNYYGSQKNPESLITREFLAHIVGTTNYDPTATYSNGDFCFYDMTGKTYIDSLWRCAADGATGAWDPTKWEELDILSLFPYALHLPLDSLADPDTIALIQAKTEGMCYITFNNQVVDAFNLAPSYKVGTATYYQTAANYFVTCEPGTTPVINYTDPAMYKPASTADMLSHAELLLQAKEFFYDDQVYLVNGDTGKLYAYHTQDTVTSDYCIDVTNNKVTAINIDAIPPVRELMTFFSTLAEEKLYNDTTHKEFAAAVILATPPALFSLDADNHVVDIYWATESPSDYSNGEKILTLSEDGITVTFVRTKPVLMETQYINHAEPTMYQAPEPMYYADGILTFVDNQIPVYDKISANVPYLHFSAPAAFTLTSPNTSTLYSVDGIIWSQTVPTVSYNSLYVRLETPVTTDFGTFVFPTGSNIRVSGNLESIVDIANGGTCKSMFKDCPIVSFSSVLPAPTSNECYAYMFEGTQLTAAPTLPTTLTQGCFKGMFKDTQITRIPQLTAITLPDSCYAEMFNGCPIKFADDGTEQFVVNYYNTPTGAFTDFATDVPTSVLPNTIYYYKEV